MKIPNNLFPSYDKNLSVRDKVSEETNFARRRLDFYGLIAHTYHIVKLSLDIATVILLLIALIILYSKIPYYNYIFATIMLVTIVAIPIKIRAEKKYVTFASAVMQAGTQWQEWDALLEKVHSGGERANMDGTTWAFLRQRDRAIYTQVIQYGKVEKTDDRK